MNKVFKNLVNKVLKNSKGQVLTSDGKALLSLGSVELQEKEVTSSINKQVVEPDKPYGGLSKVTVNAIQRGSAGTPTVDESLVIDYSKTLTPKVANTAGYIDGGTVTGEAITIKASDLVFGNIELSAPSDNDVTDFKTASVRLSEVAINHPTIDYKNNKITSSIEVSKTGWIKQRQVSDIESDITIQNPSVSLDMSAGNQVVNAQENAYMTSVTIKKPDELNPDNIKYNVTIGGIEGQYKGATEPYIEETYDGSNNLTSAKLHGQIVVRQYMYYKCISLTNITIPDSVTSIGNYAFEECSSLASANIGSDVTYIGNGAFYNCNNLKDVYYKGTEAKWKAITISGGNDALSKATIHYNSTR